MEESKNKEVLEKESFVGISIEKLLSPEFESSFSKLGKLATLSGPVNFKLKRMKDKKKKEIAFYNEARTDLLTSLAKKNDNGEAIILTDAVTKAAHYDITPENLIIVNAKNKELLSEEIEFQTIRYSELGAGHGLTPDDLAELDFIVE